MEDNTESECIHGPLWTKATSHLSLRLTAMRVTVNEVSLHLCGPFVIDDYFL